jgi:membrane protein YdbS with pleckstrin-like domain
MLPFGGPSMSYAEKNLAPGETIVHRARYHWIYYRAALALFLLVLLLGLTSWCTGKRPEAAEGTSTLVTITLLMLAATGGVYLALRVRAKLDEFVVTNRRVIKKTGWLAREVDMAPLEKIQDIAIYQAAMGRLLGYGTVALETASERGRIVFPYIAYPEKLRSAIWGQAAGPAAATTAVPPSPLPPATPSTAERLKQLEDLRTRGLLSTEEYARKRQEILSSL